MEFDQLIHRVVRRVILLRSPAERMRSAWLKFRGASIGNGTRIPPRTIFTWPHQVKIGSNCVLQPDIFFNYDHYWTPGPSMVFGDRVFIGRNCEFNIRDLLYVGNDCLIASGVKVIDHDHGISKETPMNQQPVRCAQIRIEDNVWIGANSIILKGVDIGCGSIVAAGSVVTRHVPQNQIWAGVPAKRIDHDTAMV